jgi:hypothetical protein
VKGKKWFRGRSERFWSSLSDCQKKEYLIAHMALPAANHTSRLMGEGVWADISNDGMLCLLCPIHEVNASNPLTVPAKFRE